jgi:hypothetical protein
MPLFLLRCLFQLPHLVGGVHFFLREMALLLRVMLTLMTLIATCGAARAQGKWSTAQLSQPRYGLAATSIGNVIVFAGGQFPSSPSWLMRD